MVTLLAIMLKNKLQGESFGNCMQEERKLGKCGKQCAEDCGGWTKAEEVTLSKASGIPRGGTAVT